MAPPPTRLVSRFSAAIPKIRPVRSRAGGTLFRTVGLQYLLRPNPTALYADGPMRQPYRYSPPSSGGIHQDGLVYPVSVPPGLNPLPTGDYTFPGLYVAEDPETAYVEANQFEMALIRARARNRHLPMMTVMGVEVAAGQLNLLDLTRPVVLSALRLTRRDVLREWNRVNIPATGLPGEWALTQILGFLTYQDGRFQAVRFPSARNHGRPCVFIFTDRLIPGTHRITVGDDPTGVYPRDPARCCGLALQSVP